MGFTCLLTLSPEVLYNSCYSGCGFTTRLSVIRQRCGCGSGCSCVRQRTHNHHYSSRTVLRSQRHHLQPIGALLMAPSNKPLRWVYFDPTRVGSYDGVDALRLVTRVPWKIVAEWLSEQYAYALQKPARHHFRRRRVIVGGLRQQWQADLVALSNLKNDNDGMTFILTVIDVFSKVAWCVRSKNTSAASLVAPLTTTFTKGWPKTLQTDQGLEFLNKSVQALLKKYGIHHFSTHNEETKVSIVERFNRTLKTRMWRYFTKHQTWRYIDVQQHPHRSIGMAPSQVSLHNQEEVWQRLYGHDGKGVPKLRVSDRVRIHKYKSKFEKGYMVGVHPSDPPVY